MVLLRMGRRRDRSERTEKEMIWLGIMGAFLLAELIYQLAALKGRRKKKKSLEKGLYRLLKEQVLVNTLQERISSEQASRMEMEKPFLCVEFPDTKPLIQYIFGLDECVTIGRSMENKICIRDGQLSRMHGKILNANGSLLFQDMNSANGTRIQRGVFQRISLMPGQQEYLKSGDMLLMGAYRIKIKVCYGWEAE